MKRKAEICDVQRPVTVEDMDALLRFLPLFETPGFDFGTWAPMKQTQPKTFQMPYVVLSNTSQEFLKALYDHGWIVGFDRGAWSSEASVVRQIYLDI